MSADRAPSTAALIRKTLAHSRTPLGAYRIAALLEQETGRRGYANSVYRAIVPLVDAGELIAVNLAKGWILAENPGKPTVLLFCSDCNEIIQVLKPEAFEAVRSICEHNRFTPTTLCIEMRGFCARCTNR